MKKFKEIVELIIDIKNERGQIAFLLILAWYFFYLSDGFSLNTFIFGLISVSILPLIYAMLSLAVIKHKKKKKKKKKMMMMKNNILMKKNREFGRIMSIGVLVVSIFLKLNVPSISSFQLLLFFTTIVYLTILHSSLRAVKN